MIIYWSLNLSSNVYNGDVFIGGLSNIINWNNGSPLAGPAPGASNIIFSNGFIMGRFGNGSFGGGGFAPGGFG